MKRNSPPEPTSFRLTKKNRVAILQYAELVDHTPDQFLNRFLADFLISPFNDPMAGTRESYLCHFTFKTRDSAQRVVSWLHRSEKAAGHDWDLEAEIIETPKGGFRIDAALFKNGQMYRIS